MNCLGSPLQSPGEVLPQEADSLKRRRAFLLMFYAALVQAPFRYQQWACAGTLPGSGLHQHIPEKRWTKHTWNQTTGSDTERPVPEMLVCP